MNTALLLLFIIGISNAQGNWQYLPQPAQIFYGSSIMKGTIVIDYTKIIPTDTNYLEISILLSWFTGTIGGFNSYLITLENADGSPFKHYSRVQTYDQNEISYNT
jgi:hypothetical protein